MVQSTQTPPRPLPHVRTPPYAPSRQRPPLSVSTLPSARARPAADAAAQTRTNDGGLRKVGDSSCSGTAADHRHGGWRRRHLPRGPLRRPRAQEGVLRRRPQDRVPEARHDMASGQVLRVRQLGARGGGQGAVPGDPGRLLRALRHREAAPVRRRRLRRQRRRRRRGARCFGHGRLPRRDGPDDEPSDASRELRGAAAAVRGHVPGRPRRRLRVRVRRQAASHGPPGPGPEPTTRWCQHQQAVLIGDGLRTEAT